MGAGRLRMRARGASYRDRSDGRLTPRALVLATQEHPRTARSVTPRPGSRCAMKRFATTGLMAAALLITGGGGCGATESKSGSGNGDGGGSSGSDATTGSSGSGGGSSSGSGSSGSGGSTSSNGGGTQDGGPTACGNSICPSGD